MVYYCCVRGCSAINSNIMMHLFPNDDKKFLEWIVFLKREDLLPRGKFNIRRSYKVCDKHFSDKCKFPTNRNKTNLKAGCIPDILLPDKAADEIIVPQPISIKVELEEACESHMDYDDTSEVLSDNFASEKETDKDIIVGESVVVKDEEPTEIIEKEFAEQCLDYAIKYFQQCTECNVAEEIIFLEKLKEKCPHLK
ncbi:unnamed protein product [Brassicogethes aeneus]|uniref:THAP-type domain-containing protein n=1 Tax=Brassicogethes aeneus TaxID=1431903 RepID=A0A9P0AUL8_BRAAE|nr:unnamed protein product [Brassicogethes aeneus]